MLENAKKAVAPTNNTYANINSTNTTNLQNISIIISIYLDSKKMQTGPSFLENLSNRTNADTNKYVNLLNK